MATDQGNSRKRILLVSAVILAIGARFPTLIGTLRVRRSGIVNTIIDVIVGAPPGVCVKRFAPAARMEESGRSKCVA